MNIVGLSGTNGSGKDSVGIMLDERHNYLFISGSDMLREEALKRGLPVERENLRMISAEWRRKDGLGAIVDVAKKMFDEQKDAYAGLAIVSLRNPGEADRIHELGGKVIWVDADPKIRYNRIFSRQRTAEDDKSFEVFLAEEQAEMQHSGDEATLNMAAVKDRADIFIENNGHDLEAFKDEAEKALDL
jgi:cytidylate kinase